MNDVTQSPQCLNSSDCDVTPTNVTEAPSVFQVALAEYGQGAFDIVSGYLFLAAAVGITANMVILTTYPRSREVQSPINLLFVNLAVSDLVVGITGSFLQFVTTVIRVEAKAGTVLCKGYGFFTFIAGLASLNSLTVISLERFLTVVRPLNITSLTYRGANIAIGVIWVYGLVFAAGPLGLYGRYVPEGLGTWCSVDFADREGRVYVLCIFIFEFFVPVTIMALSYGAIWWKVRMVAASQAGTSATAKAERTVALTSCLMVTCFLVAWSPYAVVSMVAAWTGVYPNHIVTTVPSLFAKSSQCYNPIIYVGLNHKFRAAVIQVVFQGKNPFDRGSTTGNATVNNPSPADLKDGGTVEGWQKVSGGSLTVQDRMLHNGAEL